MELLNQQVATLKFGEASVLSFQPVEGDVEFTLELKDTRGGPPGAQGRLVFVTAYVIESDSTDSIRLKMDRVYFKNAGGKPRGKILKIEFHLGEDEKQANITLVKYSSTSGEEEVFPLTIKCLAVKWVG